MSEPKDPRDEVIDCIIELSENANKREAFATNRDVYLAGSGLSEEAKRILKSASQRTILSAAAERIALLIVIIVLETVTTEVIVALSARTSTTKPKAQEQK